MNTIADLFDAIAVASTVDDDSARLGAVGIEVAEEEAAVAAIAAGVGLGVDEVWAAAWGLLLARLAGTSKVRVGWGVPGSHDVDTWTIDIPPGELAVADWLSGSMGSSRVVASGTNAADRPYSMWAADGWKALLRRDGRPALVWHRRPGRLDASFSTSRLDVGTVTRLGELLRIIIRKLVAPGARLADLEPLTQAEREHVLFARNRTTNRERPDAPVHELFRRQAEAAPERVALAWDGSRMTYGDLDRRSDALAEHLIAAGCRPHSLVVLYLERSPEAIVAALGILKAGAAYVPFDPDYPADRLAFVIADTGADLLVTRRVLQDVPATLGTRTVMVDDVKPERRKSAGAPFPRVAPSDLAYVMYTSGSTGTPKGVLIEHHSIINLVVNVDFVRLDRDTAFLHAAPLGFDASTLEIWGPLLNGGRCVLYLERVPTGPGLARIISTHGVTAAWLTASLFNAVVDLDPALLRGLQQLCIGGEALSPSHVRRALAALPNSDLINGYGPTECTTFATTYSIPRETPTDSRAIPIGRPIPGTEVHILNRSGRPVPVGIVGELHVGGLGVARGYLARPELDAERFVADPFGGGGRLFRTGDLVRWRDDGALDFIGRDDHQVKIRGFRVELGEIESCLSALPEIRACAVVAYDDGRTGRRLVAYVVTRTPVLSMSSVREALARTLPDFMVPAAYVRLDALPVTENGKLDRAALPPPEQSRPDLAQPFREPIGEHETLICRIFSEVLGLDRVGALDGFFALGGNSLLLLRVLTRLREAGFDEISPVTVFVAPTPAALAKALADGAAPATPEARNRSGRVRGSDGREPIAIVGMAGRFPGAPDVESFWANLCAGRESITRFAPQDLDASISREVRDDPAYVPARGILDDVERFDAAFFGVSPLEAQLMDPQHRHFLEVSWQALEHAGYVPETAPGPIGVFGGMYNATYFQRHLLHRPDITSRIGELQVMLANEKDYVTARVAHKLGLTGPAVAIHTACSTSLVAAVMAMDSLRNGTCDLALAGGVAITCPPRSGHLFQEGAMLSPDGHTRPFAAGAAGTVFSDGVAVVVLRRLADALADGDVVYAVIRGAAVNNDGSEHASLTAPNPAGQARVIAAAHDDAGIDPRTISYVEAHGTATPLGDPIEIEGLTRAFSRHTSDRGFCAIGSLKSNVGHLVTAAGAASLIKTSLSLHRRTLPPSIGFDGPNPQIDFTRTPFRVQSELEPWRNGGGPRRAGVSSFGFGGTNAHVVLEEAPTGAPSQPSSRPVQLLVVSARSAAALADASERLGAHLEASPDIDLADLAHTLRLGRRAFAHRRSVVAATVTDAARALTRSASGPAAGREVGASTPEVGWLFPGQGSQYARMGQGLYETEPVFRAAHDDCCRIIEALTGEDPRPRFFASDAESLTATSVTQPAILTLEYALARLWMNWGAKPTALIGHSVGEFACAVIAGVMSIEDALTVVLDRGRRMQALPAGSMLSVHAPAAEVESRLPADVVIAAENAPRQCVASGPIEAIERLEAELAAAGIGARRLATSQAFHSPMVASVVEPIAERIARIALQPPSIPILSTVTAEWLTAEQAVSPRYWAEHARRRVRFAQAAAHLVADPRRVLVEIGPRGTLSVLCQQAVAGTRSLPAAIPSLGDAPAREVETITSTLGRLWTLGVDVDWKAYRADERRRRVALPTYPFEGNRHWVDAPPAAGVTARPPSTVSLVPGPHVGSNSAALPAAGTRRERLLVRVGELIEEVSGVSASEADSLTPWLELGLDSLALTQLALQFQRMLSITITFRELMESHPTMASLVDLLDHRLPPDVMSPANSPTNQPPIQGIRSTRTAAIRSNSGSDDERLPVGYDVKKAFGAIARIHRTSDALTAQQRTSLETLIARYTARTRRSKEYTQAHRDYMADPRVVSGFRPLTKELTYQIVIERSQGSRVWDLDGNEYIDVLSGFGVNMFGWQPDFVREAVRRQFEAGYEIGPQHVLAGEVARLVCEVTGADRAAFCNTGSEAVMGAMRIARTATGRSTIAIFSGAYHGIFDEVIVRGTPGLRSIPAAPGILPAASQNILVLEYGTPEALAILRERAEELAAIIVEPVQSRRPDFQPIEFLRELQALARESGALLIFDEVVTGFRSHPRGVQGLFGIEADLATYGKVVGGGFPIGIIAGKRTFMDALDGGHWRFGDDSMPLVGVTYFAGTFVRHPLALAAARAVLEHLRDAGPALQEGLTARTSAMIGDINTFASDVGAPFRLKTFSSIWRHSFTEDLPYGDLIYAMLRQRGVHVLDNFPCFLTTAHSDEDRTSIVSAYRGAIAEMQAGGFFPSERRLAVAVPAAVSTRVVPSTEPQREVWLADQLGPEASLAYNESVSLRLRGDLDVGALRSAVRALAERHEALRAVFSKDGQSLFVPAAGPALDVPLRDLSELPDAERDPALAAIVERHVGEPFHLERGPLVRAELVRLDADRHVLVFTGHHIVLDGWSYWVIVKDLAALYALATGARTAPLPDAPSFADYAQDQARNAGSPEVEANERWWIEHFADAVPVLDLPTDRARPAVRTQRAGRRDHVLPADLTTDVKQLGVRRGASSFATLLAGFTALLHHITGQTDIVVGVPAAGQLTAGREDLVGHCVHLLPLRARVERSTSFAELVDATRRTMFDAYEHQLTFGRLLQVLPVARETSRLPLISMIFNIDQALTGERQSLPGIALELISNARRYETFELFVNAVDDGPAGVRLECQYNSDLFDDATVGRWLASFEVLLRGVVADASTRVGDLPVLTSADRLSLAQWNQTQADYPDNARVDELIAATIRRVPERIAVRCGRRELTYAELGARGAAITAALRALGVGRGMRVGLMTDRDEHLLPALLGTLAAGAAYVPLDPAYPADRLAFMIADAGVVVLVTTATVLESVGSAAAAVPALRLDIPGDLEVPVPLPEPAGTVVATADDPAYVIYTSGSTGRPTGVLVPHGAVVNLVSSVAREPGLADDDVVLAVTTLSFDIAVSELILPLVVGASIVLASRAEAVDGDRLRALVENQRVTFIDATPSTWRLLLAAGWQGNSDLTAICTGEALPRDLATELRRRVGRLWNGYGPTETTVWSSLFRVDDAAAPICIGRPIANTVIHVLDEDRRQVPIGIVGELYIGGHGVTLGYLNRPELTAQRFLPDPSHGAPSTRIYRTGDFGRWRGDGQLEFLGRTDSQIKVRGFRIELGEIESALASHASVAHAVVIARQDRPADIRLVGYTVLIDEMSTEEALRVHLRQTLPEYMVPSRIVAVRALPLTPSGKIDRRALPAPEAVAGAHTEPVVAPRTETEAHVARLFQDVLAVPRVGVHESFFALGGHSLLVAQMAARLGRELQQAVPMQIAFEHPTVAGLAEWIDAHHPRDVASPPRIPRRSSTTPTPLSLMQQRVWYLEQLQPGQLVFNVPVAHRLLGALDQPALTRAFSEMVRRQDTLRTVIVTADGEPAQQVLGEIDVELPVEDLEGVPRDEREAVLMRRVNEEIAQLFDLGRAPLFRARLFRLGAENHVLFFMPHHIIWDGWSFDLYCDEMAALYESYRQGEPPQYPEPPVSYRDFSVWHRGWIDGPELARQLDYWRRKLSGAPDALDVPTDYPRPAIQTGGGSTEWLTLPQPTVAALRAIAAGEEATLFMTLLAAWALLLRRLSGQAEMVIGTPVRGRSLPELERVMGFFVNTLPIRLRLDDDHSFLAALRRVRGEVIEMFEYQDVPFEHLVRVLDVPRDESRFPIYQAFFSYQAAGHRPTRWGNVQLRNVPVFQPASAQDLALWFLDGASGVLGGLNFNTDLFTSETAQRIREMYLELVEAIARDPSRTVRELLAISDHERAQLAAWNATTIPLPATSSVWSYLAPSLERYADRVAIRQGADTLRYGELSDQAARIGTALVSAGVLPGDVVGLHLERTPTMLAAVLGTLAVGATYLPLDPYLPRERLLFILGEADARLVLSDTDMTHLGVVPGRVLHLDRDLPPARELGDNQTTAADAAYLIYTSGSTGRPLGVRVPHRAVINFLVSMSKTPGLTASDRLVAVTTLSFDIAVLELLLPLAVGAEIVLARSDDASDGHALRGLLERHEATIMQATPATWRLLIEAGWRGSPDFTALCGGEALPQDLADALLDRVGALWNMYGPTETTVWSTCGRVERGSSGLSIGRPIDNTQVWILGDGLSPVPSNVPGEIYIGGDGLALGYHSRPDLTASRFVPDPFADRPGARLYRTGDLGLWRPDGALQHLGRTDFQTKIRGYRIEVTEIEWALARHPAISQAVVVARPGPGGDNRLAAYVVATAGSAPTAPDLREYLRTMLPDYMVPTAFMPIAEVPLTPNGKVDRRALPDTNVETAPAGLIGPRTATEMLVADVWRELLGAEQIDVLDNFLDLGGHSLLIMRAIAMLEGRTGKRLGPRAFIFQTLEQIARDYDEPAPQAPAPGLVRRFLSALRSDRKL